MKNILTVVTVILLLGLMGRIECSDMIKTTSQDEINKQEFIKQEQIKCMSDNLINSDYCKAILK